MTALYLERRDPERGMARFYALHLVPLLFGGWSVVREWGRIGHPGTVRTDWYGTEEEATAARVRLAAQKAKRGYVAARAAAEQQAAQIA